MLNTTYSSCVDPENTNFDHVVINNSAAFPGHLFITFITLLCVSGCYFPFSSKEADQPTSRWVSKTDRITVGDVVVIPRLESTANAHSLVFEYFSQQRCFVGLEELRVYSDGIVSKTEPIISGEFTRLDKCDPGLTTCYGFDSDKPEESPQFHGSISARLSPPSGSEAEEHVRLSVVVAVHLYSGEVKRATLTSTFVRSSEQ